MDGGSDPAPVVVPGPSAAEQALQQEQADILRIQKVQLEKSLARSELLDPLLMKRFGIEEIKDASGKVTGYRDVPDPLEGKRKDVEGLLLDRSLAAMRGELPVNPALLRDLGKQEEDLRATLRQRLGPGYETSSPGIEALAKFQENKAILLEGARRGDLTLAEQLGLARQGSNLGIKQTEAGNVSAFGQNKLPFIGSGIGLAGAYDSFIAGYRADRQMQLQAALATAQIQQQADQANNSFMGQIFGGIGTVAGLALAGPRGIFGRR